MLQQTPSDGEALVALTEMATSPEEISAAVEASKVSRQGSAAYQLATGNIALRKRDMAGLETAVRKAVELDPKSSETHQALGILYLLQRNRDAAGPEIKAAAELAPLRSNFRITFAEFQRQTAGTEAAVATLKDLTKAAPDFFPAWTLLGRIALSEKKYDEALKSLDNVFSRDPQNVDARLIQCEVFLAQGDPKKAIAELEKVDSAYPGNAPIKVPAGPGVSPG